jgi:hypothetical protein
MELQEEGRQPKTEIREKNENARLGTYTSAALFSFQLVGWNYPQTPLNKFIKRARS